VSRVCVVLSSLVHLIPADKSVCTGSTLVAACGELVTDEPDVEDDPIFCPKCVRTVIRWSAPS
jgi:hypothetical protein